MPYVPTLPYHMLASILQSVSRLTARASLESVNCSCEAFELTALHLRLSEYVRDLGFCSPLGTIPSVNWSFHHQCISGTSVSLILFPRMGVLLFLLDACANHGSFISGHATSRFLLTDPFRNPRSSSPCLDHWPMKAIGFYAVSASES